MTRTPHRRPPIIVAQDADPARRFDELAHVRWLERHAGGGRRIALGIGDDMAGVRLRGRAVWVACDMLADGVHFDTQRHTCYEIGRKAMAVNLSDCAAMAVRPVAAVVSVALPKGSSPANARRLHQGLSRMGGRFGVAVVGGDTICWSRPLVIDVAIVAEAYPGVRPIRRGGAKPGDVIHVTGALGGSILGKHLRFTPRVRESEALARKLGRRLHAMMDISDGLLLDLHRMCVASGVGAELDETLLTRIISPAARKLAARDGRPALRHALTDGEDFELLLAVAPDANAASAGLLPIGRCTRRGFVLRSASGRRARLAPEGYVHR